MRTRFLLVVILLLPGLQRLSAQQEDIIMQARKALDSGRLLAAVELAEQAASLFPESAEAWMVLGASLERQPGESERTLEVYRKALRLVSDHPGALLAVGKIHLARMKSGIVEVEASGAIRSFDRLIELNPSHPQAYWMRGIAFLEGLGDLLRAAADFERQLEVVPEHPEASVHLLQLAVDMSEWDLAEKLASPILLGQQYDTRIYRPMLKLYIEKREWYAAALVARRFLAVLPQNELDVVYDLSPLLPASAKGAYGQLRNEAGMHYWRSYWGERGGADLDDPSSRLIEHIWRVTEARARYGSDHFPWDIRGEMFVRYGPPDHIISSTSGTSIDLIMDGSFQHRLRYRLLDLNMPYSAIDRIVSISGLTNPILLPGSGGRDERFEIWIYLDEGLLFRLHDPLMRGVFRLAYPVDQQFNDHLIARLPVFSEVEESTEPLRPMLQIAQFRGLEGRTRFHTYFSLPVVEIEGPRAERLASGVLASSVILSDENSEIVAEGTRKRRLQAGPATEVQRSRRFVEAVSFLTNAGRYWFSAFVEHAETDRSGSFGPRLIQVRDYSGSEVAMSDVVLALTDSLGEYEGNLLDEGVAYMPQPGGVFDLERPLFVYFEIYNLARNREGVSVYDLTFEVFPEPRFRMFPDQIEASFEELPVTGERTPSVSLTSTYRSLRTDVMHSTELSMDGHAEDFYRLRVSVTDSLSGSTISRETTFRVLYSVYSPFPPPPRL